MKTTSKVLALARLWCPVWIAASTLRCIPDDTTPERGAIDVTLVGSEGIVNGIPETSFEDGWSLTFDRFLVGFLPVYATCGPHTDEDAVYVTDVKESLIFRIRGFMPLRCHFGFIVGTIHGFRETAPGPGVTQEDIEFFESQTVYAQVEAVARRGTLSKRLSLTLTHRTARAVPSDFDCWEEINGSRVFGVDVPSRGKVDARLTLRGEQLFRTALEEGGGVLRFDALAHADDNPKWGNQDGIVTYDELSKVGLVQIDPRDGTYADPSRLSVSLAEFIRAQFAFVWRFGERGRCTTFSDDSR